MASFTCRTRGLSGRRIADRWGRRPRGDLLGVIKGNVIEFHAGEKCLHNGVLALTGNVSLHRRDEILRIQSNEAWSSGRLADAVIAVTRRAGNNLVTRSSLVGSNRVSEILRV